LNGAGGGLAGGSFVPGLVGTNVGTAGIAGTTSVSSAEQQRKCTASPAECQERKNRGGGASADFKLDGFGFLFSAQTGGIARRPTDLENGFDSTLRGLALGMDYRFSDRLLMGLTLGHNDNHATFRDNAGSMRSKLVSSTLYLTYVPTDDAYLGAYLGTGRIKNASTKPVLLGAVTGQINADYTGSQDISGLSGGYDWSMGGSKRLGAYLNLDAARTRLDSYTESGNTGLELIQPTQSVSSLASTLGLRFSAAPAFDWGTLLPELRFAWVHEYRNDARVISSALALDPSTRFTVRTDAPDRNYFIGGAGATFEVGNGARWFVDYEKRGGHTFLSSWAASVGLIVGF
jgi:outer membrane autotransporter protein